MHRILIYADTTESGLLKMEEELLDCLDDENPSINLDWVSWQLDSYCVSFENRWKILYFLINESKIKMKN